jgi:hypothetical protein
VRLPLRYFIRWVSLFQSSLSGARTLIVKNARAVQVSGLALLVAYSVLVTRLWHSRLKPFQVRASCSLCWP